MTNRRADALLDAAEDEFATAGFESGSLRRIMRTAGTDPGAIHYHFGGREALADAVLNRILAPINARRLELLAEAAALPTSPTATLLVEALIRPDIESAHDLHARSPGRARLIAAVYLRPATFVESAVAARFAPVAEAFLPHLHRALPERDATTLAWRIRWIVFGTIGAVLADGTAPFDRHPDELIDELSVPLAAALNASRPGATGGRGCDGSRRAAAQPEASA